MQKDQNSINCFKNIVKRRRSWKLFNKKAICNTIIDSIIEDASYSPSSFGLKPWKVLVIQKQELKIKLAPYCDYQPQVTSCSHLLVVLSHKGELFQQSSPWMINNSMHNRNLITTTEYQTFYEQRFLRYMKQISDWSEWSIRQAYILLQTILLSAAAHNVDSCPMEGINTTEIVKFLEKSNLITKNTYNCPFVIALGYHEASNTVREKLIDDLDDKFIFIN